MYKAILLLTYAATIIFAMAAIWLIILNPSPRITQSALSIAAAAAVTGFLATFLSLKESERHDAFVSTAFWNRSTVEPAFIQPPARLRRTMLALDASRVFNLAKETKLQTPTDDFHLSADLLAYMIVRELCRRFGTSWSGEVVEVSGAGGSMIASYQQSRREREPQAVLSDSTLKTRLAANAFGHTAETLQLAVPPGTDLIVRGYDGRRATVSLKKANFFDIEITIIPQAGGGDLLNFVPEKFGLTQDQAANLRAYPLLVQIDAKFDRLTSENPETEYHKAWLDEIAKVLRLGFADP